VDESTCRDRQQQCKQEMYDLVEHLKAKKQEYRAMKQNNELEREEIRKQERMAQSFKFTKMSKKMPFFPSLDARGFI